MRYWTFFSATASHIVDDLASPTGYTLCQKVVEVTSPVRLSLEDAIAQSTCAICDAFALANERREAESAFVDPVW